MAEGRLMIRKHQRFDNGVLVEEWEEQIPTNLYILGEISRIEATVTQRRIREALLTEDGAAWMSDVEKRLAILRAQLQ